MLKTVVISDGPDKGKSVDFRATAALPSAFRAAFGKDFFSELHALKKRSDKSDDSGDGDFVALVERLAFLMARSAHPDSVPADIVQWLDQFDDPNFIFRVAPDIVDLYQANAETASKAKKKKGRRNGR